MSKQYSDNDTLVLKKLSDAGTALILHLDRREIKKDGGNLTFCNTGPLKYSVIHDRCCLLTQKADALIIYS